MPLKANEVIQSNKFGEKSKWGIHLLVSRGMAANIIVSLECCVANASRETSVTDMSLY